MLRTPQLQIEKAAVFASLLFNQGEPAASTLLNQTTRMTIFNFIKDNPGLHFRAISDRLSIPIGVLQYHLGLLLNRGLVSVYKDGRYKRYFEPRKFTEVEMKIISAFRRRGAGMILTALLNNSQITHSQLARQLNMSSQALSWQMNQLEKTKLVKRLVEGSNAKYSLSEVNQEAVGRCARFLVDAERNT